MVITAKFDGRCAKCGLPTKKGSEIEYQNKQAFHPDCALFESGLSEDEQIALADRLQFRHFSWDDLQPVQREGSDEPERNDSDSRNVRGNVQSSRNMPTSDTIDCVRPPAGHP